ncbi:MAG: hypothetical protein G01um101430_62 [Parcubacteria group bacterium Gr01-1014_30]|nr:MAG: hypothetical protein G01um101430_62 [Parcubacteria group bacterium Gr01-1014_30]
MKTVSGSNKSNSDTNESISEQSSTLSGFKNWRLKHPILWAVILSVALIFITRYIVYNIPELDLLYRITLWFIAPILVFGAIYKHLAKRPKDIATDSLEDVNRINRKQAILLLLLLALEMPLLLLNLYVFIGNKGSIYGDYGVLTFIFGLTLFMPSLIAFIIFLLGYIKGTFRHWQQLSKYNRASFFIFLFQFVLYLKFLNYF